MRAFGIACQIFFAAFISLTISCQKSDDESVTSANYYHVRFKVDGVVKEYKTNAVMKFGSNGVESYFLSAKVQQGQNEFPVIKFDVSGIKKPISTDVAYTNSATGNLAAKLYYGENRIDEFLSLPLPGNFKLQLTEKTDSYVKGTFSGTVSETFVYLPLEKKITEGTFYLQAVNQ